MATEPANKDPKEVISPAGSAPVPENEQDIDFDAELASLENDGAPAPALASVPVGKTPDDEARQAEYTLTSTAKRLKELGRDPSAILGTPPAPVAPPISPVPAPVDTSKFVTKLDLARQEADRLSRTPGESKVIMWYVVHKGLSVQDAHLLANKGRMKTAISEINRARAPIASPGGAGSGSAPVIDVDEPNMDMLDAATKERLAQSGMKYDSVQKAFVGTKSALSWIKGKGWVNGRVVPDRK